MSQRPIRPEEARLWALVARTVRRSRARGLTSAPPEPTAAALPPDASAPTPPGSPRRPLAAPEALAALASAGVGWSARSAPQPARLSQAPHPVHAIEPNRKRRIVRAREPIGARLDLHGLDQDRARAALHDFIARAHEDGLRAVLVITGKGDRTGAAGVLRLRTPEWLAEAPSRRAVAGVSQAEARHGGEGALYVALKPPR